MPEPIAFFRTEDAGAKLFGDFVQPFQIEAPGLRGRLVRLGAAVDAVLAPHDYPPAVEKLLGEAMAMAAVLASGLKYEGIFTLQIQGDGPVAVVMVDITSDGDMRGYARYDMARLDASGPAPEAPVPRLFGAGVMAFTVDQGPDTERYQGVTPLEGATLGECAHAYFRQSEQIETAIRLCVSDPGEADGGRRAAAIMLQRLPRDDAREPDAEEDWRRAVILMSSATPAELLEPRLSANQILFRLFHEDGVRVFRRRALRHRCRCSRTKVEAILRSFPSAEIRDMLEENGRITVTCEFCKTVYALDEGDVEALASR
ncbi:MAG: Hsp33 family molecular chaperone HslO [Rhodospirillales bacterium]|nr:Hsp33 family molecular chaperone HslO [Rhodospirillales bacterium]